MIHIGAHFDPKADRVDLVTVDGLGTETRKSVSASELASATRELGGKDRARVWWASTNQLGLIWSRLYRTERGQPESGAPLPDFDAKGGCRGWRDGWTFHGSTSDWARTGPESPEGAEQLAHYVHQLSGLMPGLSARAGCKAHKKLSGTPGGTAIKLCYTPPHTTKDGAGWTDPKFTHTLCDGDDLSGSRGHLEFLRAGFYGGRCQLFPGGRGLVKTHGSAIPTWLDPDIESRTLPKGWRIFHIDIASAYPAFMRLQLPDLRDPPRQSKSSLLLSKMLTATTRQGKPRVYDGSADVQIRLNGCARVIPLRVYMGAFATLWPNQGTIRGVFPLRSLRRAVETGAVIEKLHLLSYAPSTSRILERAASSLIYDIERQTGAVKAGLKNMGRHLFGKMGARPLIWEWAKPSEIYEHNDRLPTIERAGVDRNIHAWAHWGPHVHIQREDRYPSHASPMVASSITSYGHLELESAERAIRAAGGEPIYCDTDSFVFAVKDSHKKIKLNWGSRPGQWALKGSDKAWVVHYRPKIYVHSDETFALSGVPRDVGIDAFRESRIEFERLPAFKQTLISGADPTKPRIQATGQTALNRAPHSGQIRPIGWRTHERVRF